MIFSAGDYAGGMTEYGARLEHALTERKVSATALAKHMGVSYQAVKRVIDGKTAEFSASNHAKAASYLNISPDWLLSGAGDMTPSATAATALSGKARQLGVLLDRIKDQDARLLAFSHCVLVLSQNPAYRLPLPAPTPGPPETTKKPPERNHDERPQ